MAMQPDRVLELRQGRLVLAELVKAAAREVEARPDDGDAARALSTYRAQYADVCERLERMKDNEPMTLHRRPRRAIPVNSGGAA